MEYAKALWEQKTAERYAGYWHRLVEGMAADEGAVIDSLEVLGEEEAFVSHVQGCQGAHDEPEHQADQDAGDEVV